MCPYYTVYTSYLNKLIIKTKEKIENESLNYTHYMIRFIYIFPTMLFIMIFIDVLFIVGYLALYFVMIGYILKYRNLKLLEKVDEQ